MDAPVYSKLSEGVDMLGIFTRNQMDYFNDYDTILDIVDKGLAPKYFRIGEQIPCTWNDGTADRDMPWDIVDFRNVVNAKGRTVPAMIIQSHWCLPAMQFDASEAAFVPAAALTPKKYKIGIGTNWGTHCVAGKRYSFTTTVEVPVGGQVVVTRSGSNQYVWGAPDQNPSTWVVYTYAATGDITPLEGPLTLTEEDDGELLGDLTSAIKYSESGINNLQRAAYGYNRDSHSATLQYLNSDGAAGTWWLPQNPFDRPPQQLASVRGFKAGLSEDFLKIVSPIKITTALNTVSDSQIGTTEEYSAQFWLPSLEEEYCVPQLANVEGPYWPYWKDRLDLSSPQEWYGDHANANHIRYLITNHSSAQRVRLRSAFRGHATYTWNVTTTGYVNTYYAATALYALAPACAICSSD